MNDVFLPAPRRSVAARPKTRARSPATLWALCRPAGLRGMLATWDERKRFRLDLERKAMHAPHLVDDVGLTRRQAEVEIAKPFWQA